MSGSKKEESQDNGFRLEKVMELIKCYGLPVVGVFAILFAVIRFFYPAQTLQLEPAIMLLIALVVFVWPQIEKFKFNIKDGQLEIEKKIDRIVKQNEELSIIAESNVVPRKDVLKPAVAESLPTVNPVDQKLVDDEESYFENRYNIPPVINVEDPQKGRFGGKSSNNFRKLSARVQKSELRKDWCTIELMVAAEQGGALLEGVVYYFLHDSFAHNVRAVNVIKGVAMLKLLAWGAFTVGVIADDGATRLELDLAEDEVDAPGWFKKA